MTKLSSVQVLGYIKAAGFPAYAIPTAAAIVFAESSGETTAVGDQHLVDAKWGPSIGLFQVRTLKAGYQKSAADKMRGTQNSERLMEPLYNAQTAFAIFDEAKSFNPWSTFKNGTYLGQLRGQDSAVDEVIPEDSAAQGALDTATGAVNNLANVNSLAGLLQSGSLWKRAGWLFGGYGLLLAGLLIILLSNKEVQNTAKTGAGVGLSLIPGGGVVAGVSKTAGKAAKGATAARTAAAEAAKEAGEAAAKGTKAVAKTAGGAAKAAGSGATGAVKTAGKAVAGK